MRLQASKGEEAEKLGEKLTNLTDRWDEMLRWAAGRYQLLVLSRHYLDTSKHVVQYLEKIEEKLSTAKDIPPAVLEKIKEESRKAKVRLKCYWCFKLGQGKLCYAEAQNIYLWYLNLLTCVFRLIDARCSHYHMSEK